MNKLTLSFLVWNLFLLFGSASSEIGVLNVANAQSGIQCRKCEVDNGRCAGTECIPDEESGTAYKYAGENISVPVCTLTKLGYSSCTLTNVDVCIRYYTCNIDCASCVEESPDEVPHNCANAGIECSCSTGY